MSARPTLFRTRRFAVEAAITFVLVLGLFMLGFSVASMIIGSLPQGPGVQWVATGPGDAFAAKLSLAIVAALTPLVTLVAMVLHRFGGRAHPGWRPTLIYLALPLAAVAAGLAVQVHGLHSLGHLGSTAGTPYTLAVRDVLPGFLTKNLLAITALVLWGAAFAAARASRASRKS